MFVDIINLTYISLKVSDLVSFNIKQFKAVACKE